MFVHACFCVEEREEEQPQVMCESLVTYILSRLPFSVVHVVHGGFKDMVLRPQYFLFRSLCLNFKEGEMHKELVSFFCCLLILFS